MRQLTPRICTRRWQEKANAANHVGQQATSRYGQRKLLSNVRALNVQGRCVDIFFWRSSLDCEFFYLRFFFVNRRSRDSEVPHSIRKMSESHVVVSWNSHLRTFTSRKNYDLTVGKEGSTVTAENPKMPAGIRENAHGGQSLKKPRFFFAGKNERIRLPREKPKQKM